MPSFNQLESNLSISERMGMNLNSQLSANSLQQKLQAKNSVPTTHVATRSQTRPVVQQLENTKGPLVSIKMQDSLQVPNPRINPNMVPLANPQQTLIPNYAENQVQQRTQDTSPQTPNFPNQQIAQPLKLTENAIKCAKFIRGMAELSTKIKEGYKAKYEQTKEPTYIIVANLIDACLNGNAQAILNTKNYELILESIRKLLITETIKMKIREIKSNPAFESYKLKLSANSGDPESAKNLAIIGLCEDSDTTRLMQYQADLENILQALHKEQAVRSSYPQPNSMLIPQRPTENIQLFNNSHKPIVQMTQPLEQAPVTIRMNNLSLDGGHQGNYPISELLMKPNNQTLPQREVFPRNTFSPSEQLQIDSSQTNKKYVPPQNVVINTEPLTNTRTTNVRVVPDASTSKQLKIPQKGIIPEKVPLTKKPEDRRTVTNNLAEPCSSLTVFKNAASFLRDPFNFESHSTRIILGIDDTTLNEESTASTYNEEPHKKHQQRPANSEDQKNMYKQIVEDFNEKLKNEILTLQKTGYALKILQTANGFVKCEFYHQSRPDWKGIMSIPVKPDLPLQIMDFKPEPNSRIIKLMRERRIAETVIEYYVF